MTPQEIDPKWRQLTPEELARYFMRKPPMNLQEATISQALISLTRRGCVKAFLRPDGVAVFQAVPPPGVAA